MKIEGRVIGGNKLGRKLGFPTANLLVDSTLQAGDGVYSARVTVGSESYDAMAYLGCKPSAGGGRRVLEAHLFDFDGDLYDRTIAIDLQTFIRPERRFDSFDELREQLERDARIIRNS